MAAPSAGNTSDDDVGRGVTAVGRVAVIGMAGRFPGAATATDLWRNVRGRVTSIAPIRVREFDARFFGYTEAEATLVDPRLRVLHECVWQALEDAGYAPDGDLGRVGMYVGGRPDPRWLCAAARVRNSVGTTSHDDNESFATSLSYRFGLQGPSLTLQTSSSSSLVAVHVASRAISTGECDMAIAAGVGITAPVESCPLAEAGGEVRRVPCRPFDARADGALVADGCGVVVLKALPQALADGDHVYAVVLGSAINNDGRQKLEYGAPSVAGQVEVIRRAHEAAGVHADTIGYVETHANGTPLADPVEIEALTQAFHTSRRRFCAIGSVKTNIGDLTDAAGIAAFIKAVLAVRDAVLPPTLHYHEPNPRIDFAATPFVVNRRLRKWKSHPRRACVNSVGAGGTSAHVVIEEAPRRPWTAASRRRSHLIVLSATQASGLDRAAARLRAHIDGDRRIDIGDVAHTLRVGRASLPFRRAMLCRDRGDALAALAGDRPERVWTHVSSPPVRLTFVLQGNCAKYPLLDGTLYARQPAFRVALDACLDALGSAKADVSRALGVDTASRRRAAGGSAITAHLALFVWQHACAALLRDLGVQPSALLGEGVGELAAACVAGVFRLEDALRVVRTRAELLESRRSAAGSPGDTSADEGAVTAYARSLTGIALQPPLVPLVVNPTARMLAAARATDAGYWADRLRQSSDLPDGVAALLQTPAHVLVDLGPDEVLRTSARNAAAGPFGHTLISLGGDSGDGESRLLAAICQLWTAGIDIRWAALDSHGRRRVPLPAHEFDGVELPDITATEDAAEATGRYGTSQRLGATPWN